MTFYCEVVCRENILVSFLFLMSVYKKLIKSAEADRDRTLLSKADDLYISFFCQIFMNFLIDVIIRHFIEVNC